MDDRNENDIYLDAKKIADRRRRATWLDGVAGRNSQLRRRVDSLLDDSEGDETQDCAGVRTPPSTCELGATAVSDLREIGAYKLLSKIGEGGMGVVYLAFQSRPVSRKVALKLIKPGMDSQQVVARFEAEMQALARLDHPCVAKVFDAGATAEGHSFFVMEYVHGLPIDVYCDRQRLSINQRLSLFIDVCAALQHAHQKGIVHRDVKPSNILVSMDGDQPIVKVIDFGVAKAISGNLTDSALCTELGQFLGTPEYMSPEQAEASSGDIDTRTDIYSLGVLLYKLLSGTLPFEPSHLRSGGLVKLQRVICEEEPKSPSDRLSTIENKQLTSIAETRRLSLHELKRELRGELDWVVLKAMEKDRKRRYESCSGLAMDIKRYLAREPILARPPSSWYRLRKFIQRNRLATSGAAVIMLASAIAFAAVCWGLASSRYHTKLYREERDLAKSALRIADEQRAAANLLRAEATRRADELSRKIYLIHLANADTAIQANDLLSGRVELAACPESERGWEWFFLDERIRNTIPVRRRGSEKPAFTADGRYMAAIGVAGSNAENQVLVWDLIGGEKPIKQFVGKGKLVSLALSPDEHWLAAGSADGEVIVWSMQDAGVLWRVQRNEDRFDGLAFSPDGSLLATANWDGKLNVLNAMDGSLVYSHGFDVQLRKVMFGPQGKWLVAGFNSLEESAVIVDTEAWQIADRFPQKGASVPTFSPDGKRIATGNPDGTITYWQWDGRELSEQFSWNAASTAFLELDFSEDGSRLVSAAGFSIRVWDAEDGEEIASFDAGSNAYWLSHRPMSDEVAIFTESHGIRLWRYRNNAQGLIADTETAEHFGMIFFSRSGDKIALNAVDDQDPSLTTSIVILDATSGRKVMEIDGEFYAGCQWLKDDREVLLANAQTGMHELYELDSGRRLREFPPAVDSSVLPYVSRDERLLTSFGSDLTIRQWDLESGEYKGTVDFDRGSPWWQPTVDAQGKYAALAFHQDYRLQLWDLHNKQPVSTLPTPGFFTSTMQFSKDAQRLFVGSDGGKLALMDVATASELRQFSGHVRKVVALSLSPQETQMVSSDSLRTIVWDVESSQPLITLASGDPGVVWLDWSEDGSRIAAARDDGSIQIWNLPADSAK